MSRSREPSSLLSGLAVVCALSAMGCGSATDTAREARGKSISPAAVASVTARPASVEQLASALDCTASITVDAADFRQGVCSAASSQYSMLAFATGKGQRDWLEYAQMYGGSYLVGERWIIAARPKEALTAARAKLGGSIQETETWGAAPPSATGSGR